MTTEKHLRAYVALKQLHDELKSDGEAPDWEHIGTVIEHAVTVFDPECTALLDTNAEGKPYLNTEISDYILRTGSIWIEDDEHDLPSIWIRNMGDSFVVESYVEDIPIRAAEFWPPGWRAYKPSTPE